MAQYKSNNMKIEGATSLARMFFRYTNKIVYKVSIDEQFKILMSKSVFNGRTVHFKF